MPIAMNDAGDVVYLTDQGGWEPARVAENPQTKERLAWDGRAWVAAAKPAAPAYGSDKYIQSLAKEFGADPEDIRSRVGGSVASAGAEGIPVVGGLLQQAGPAISAAVQPLTGAGAAGASFGERRKRNAELEERMRGDFDREHGALSTAAGLAGGAAALGGVGLTATGARLLGVGAQTLPGMALRGAASGAGIGAADAVTRGDDLVSAAGIGGVIGAAVPPVARLAGAVAAPIVSNIRARVNPAGYVQGQFGRSVGESGMTPQEIADAVTQAAAEGQPMFTVADAMGNAGQRQLAAVARAPGEGRTAAVNFLEQRQAGQGRRVANQLAEGFDAPETAAQMRARLVAERDAAADAVYPTLRADAGPVNVSGVIAKIDDTLRPGLSQFANPGAQLAPDSVEAALSAVRSRLTDGRSLLTDFEALQRVRDDLADAIKRADRAGEGNKVRLLSGVQGKMDAAMEAASEGFREANARFAAASRIANPKAQDLIAEGRLAATRGRVEDTVPRVNSLTPEQRAGYRTGYVDPLIEAAQGSAVGVNKARALTNDAFEAEARAMAPGADRMLRQTGRENTMFETRRQATGGSQTIDNAADAAALGEAPAIAHQLLTGNWTGAGRTLVSAIGRYATGSTPEVRREMANILLLHGGRVTGRELQDILNQAVERVRQSRTRALLAASIAARDAQSPLSRRD